MLLLILLRAILLSRTSLALENLALRQQVAGLKRSVPRPRIRLRDPVYWVILRLMWSGCPRPTGSARSCAGSAAPSRSGSGRGAQPYAGARRWLMAPENDNAPESG